MNHKVLKEESGFTLTEALVTMMLMILVLFALYSIFDMSIRVFSFGNDKIEATENARIGLFRMEREIRAAYPQNKAASPSDETLLLTDTDTDTITFGNDTNGNRVVDSNEIITYQRGASDPSTLQRVKNGNSQPAVEFVSGLQFDYLDELGNGTTYDAAKIVKITLTIDKDGRTQTLSTDVSLRNRNA